MYRELQHHKCAYCERELPREPYASGEHDVEHFRPKGRCVPWPPKEWPPTSGTSARAFDFEIRSGRAAGYPTLAYELDNYATSCGTCNQALKHDAFPIEGGAKARTSALAKLNAEEKPLLLYPIGRWDSDPETVITFEGVRAVPAVPNPRARAHRRALVTIEFFQLNAREDLTRQRQQVLKSLVDQYRLLALTKDRDVVAEAKAQIARLTHPSSSQASCARSFDRLMSTDPVAAFRLWDAGRGNLDVDAKDHAHPG